MKEILSQIIFILIRDYMNDIRAVLVFCHSVNEHTVNHTHTVDRVITAPEL